MKDFKPIDETAEKNKKRMTFIQEFLQKKYGFGILFFVLVAFGIFTSIKSYNEGIEKGEKNSKNEITSLNNSLSNRNLEIVTLKNNNSEIQKQYDDCRNEKTNLNLEDEVLKALEKSDRLGKILERKILSAEKQTSDINSILLLKK